jgi:hypothetical protein
MDQVSIKSDTKDVTSKTIDNDSYSKLISRIEWVLVSRDDTNNTLAIDNNWNFSSLFNNGNDINASSSQRVEEETRQLISRSDVEFDKNKRYCYYYDKSNDRCGWHILNDNNNNINPSSEIQSTNTDSESSKITMKKRKRNDTLWKMRYGNSYHPTSQDLNTDSTTRNLELVFEDQYVDPRQLIPIYYVNRPRRRRPTTTRTTWMDDDETIPILVTETTDLYRLLAASQIHMNKEGVCSSVLEIGSSTGMTSEVVWKQLHPTTTDKSTQNCVQRWIGFDTGAEMVQIVRNKLKQTYTNQDNNNNNNDNVQWAMCYHIDPLLDPDTAYTLVHEHFRYNDNDGTETKHATMKQNITVLIDIGGNREENAVLRMIDWVLHTFQSIPTNQFQLYQIILKSESIYTTLSTRKSTSKSVVLNSTEWYITRLRMALRDSLPKHPLQAPKRFVPITNINYNDIDGSNTGNDGNTKKLICRYHNYHKDGCAKIDGNKSNGKICPYDHDHCHICLSFGHIARNCPVIHIDSYNNT